MAGQIQFMFANPIKRKKGKTMRKRVTKRSNPFKFVYQKGSTKKQGTTYLTDSEFKGIREGSKAANKAVMILKKKMRESGNQVSDATFKSLSSQLRQAEAKQKKLNSSLKRAISKRRTAEAEFKKLTKQGYEVVDSAGKEIKTLNRSQMKSAKKALYDAEQLEKKIEKEMKKLKADLKKKGGSMAKKKARKKVARKKVARKKVAKKATTRKKATKKKVAKKKTTKRKVAKKATKRKVAKKATKKKVVRRKATKKKATTRKKVARKKVARKASKKTTSVKTRKAYNKKKKTMPKGSSLVHKFKSAGRGKGQKGKRYSTVKRTKRTNPIGGMMKKIKPNELAKKHLKHDLSEAGGLLAGGFTYQLANKYARMGLEKVAPNALSKLESGVIGNYIGSLMPILIAVAVDKVNQKSAKNKQVDALAKGLIGAGVVGLGVALHEQVLGADEAPAVAGYSDADLLSHDHSMTYDADMGAMQTEDFGNLQYENFGAIETSDFGSIQTDDFGHADANMEFAEFSGEMEL